MTFLTTTRQLFKRRSSAPDGLRREGVGSWSYGLVPVTFHLYPSIPLLPIVIFSSFRMYFLSTSLWCQER
jgi:hypothetical protein